MGDDTGGVTGISNTSISSSNCSEEAVEGFSSSLSSGMTYSSPKGTISFDGMQEIGTTSMGFVKEFVKVFAFLGAKDSEVAEAFLFFTAALSAALVFFASDAEGRLIFFICDDFVGGADEIGTVSSGTTIAVALACSDSSGAATNASAGLDSGSSGATLEVALSISSAAGISSALVIS